MLFLSKMTIESDKIMNSFSQTWHLLYAIRYS